MTPDEQERLGVLRRYGILDTPPDDAFDRITRIAARRFDVPIAIVSFVDRDRIWFKSRHGLTLGEIPRHPGLCASAIADEQPRIVPDALLDPRCSSHPLVSGEFGLRFYAGAQLRAASGHRLGTLCVIDHAPRQVTQGEVADLVDLAGIVMDEIELRRSTVRALGEREVLLKEIHHRIKNNLQIVSSLLSSQRRLVPSGYQIHFDETLRRIQSMGRLHEKFYEGDDAESIELMAYLRELSHDVVDTFGMAERVEVRVEGPDLSIDVDTGTPLALLVAEVISNACKHGFPGNRRGMILVRITREDARFRLEIRDDGVGLDQGSGPSAGNMGRRLIARFAQQLGGTVRLYEEAGTVCELVWPLRGAPANTGASPLPQKHDDSYRAAADSG